MPQNDPDPREFVNIADFERHALEVLSAMPRDYYRSGAWDEITLRANREAWERVALWYRVMRDVSRRTTACEVLGGPSAMPLCVAPTALHRMAHPEGELATARAAAAAGVPMILSSFSSTGLEEVRAAGLAVDPKARHWMQVYIGTDRGFIREYAKRIHAAGYEGLVLTVDTPIWGIRERDIRNHFRVPDGMRVVNLERPGGPTGHTGRGIHESLAWAVDAALTWRDFEWLRDASPLPVVVKGICRPEDASRAVALGAAGVLVSNHGGRQLDGAPATVEALRPCVEAVAGRVPVLVDGGVRRGVDLVRARALGAQAVCVGRPILWGLATAGEAGVARVLEILRGECDVALALCGCTRPDEATRELLGPG
ncbi:MAG: alpha-hydroxy acid oxidase [Phycisphaerales bacterium]